MAIKPWTLNTVTASTVTDLVAPGANKAVAVVGLVVANNDASNTANIVVSLTDSGNSTKFSFKLQLLPGGSEHIETKIFLAAGATPDKIRVLSDQASTSFLASGDES